MTALHFTLCTYRTYGTKSKENLKDSDSDESAPTETGCGQAGFTVPSARELGAATAGGGSPSSPNAPRKQRRLRAQAASPPSHRDSPVRLAAGENWRYKAAK
ncbi:unnamed protein product [Coccothraustes coccothraustes]